MKSLLRLLIMAMLALCFDKNAMSQMYSVNFAYDANGNRISRMIIVTDYRNTSIDTTAIVRSTSLQQEKYKDDNDSISISIYPNPAREGLTIRLTSYDEYTDIEVNLYSTLGVCLKNIAIVAEETYIDLSDLPSGSYFLKLMGYDDRRIWKIIKR